LDAEMPRPFSKSKLHFGGGNGQLDFETVEFDRACG
jgi:hypothetical protein